MPLLKKKKVKSYVVMWDTLGLECIFDSSAAREVVEQWEKEKAWSILKEEDHRRCPEPIPLKTMILRARFNNHRCYEIYEFTSTMSMDDIKQVFKDDPQVIVNWIRENGHKIYSDYQRSGERRIS